MDTIDAEARMQAGLMPMHPAILRARRARRWRRVAMWSALCTACLVCTEIVWRDAFELPGELWMRLAVYGVLTLPVLALNVWFLPHDRARERQFAAQWDEAPQARLEDVVRFEEAQRQREIIDTEARATGATGLLVGAVVTMVSGVVATWLVHDKFEDWLSLFGFVAFVCGVVALINASGSAVRYVSARVRLRVIREEREELMHISAQLPGGAVLVGGLSSASEGRERGALSATDDMEDAQEGGHVESTW